MAPPSLHMHDLTRQQTLDTKYLSTTAAMSHMAASPPTTPTFSFSHKTILQSDPTRRRLIIVSTYDSAKMVPSILNKRYSVRRRLLILSLCKSVLLDIALMSRATFTVPKTPQLPSPIAYTRICGAHMSTFLLSSWRRLSNRGDPPRISARPYAHRCFLDPKRVSNAFFIQQVQHFQVSHFGSFRISCRQRFDFLVWLTCIIVPSYSFPYRGFVCAVALIFDTTS